MTRLEQIWALRNERDRLKMLLDSYDDVRAHIAPKLNPQAITLTMLDEQRHELTTLVEGKRAEIRTLQDQCSHAWERIGEAKPPFWQCVNCGRTSATDPLPARSVENQ